METPGSGDVVHGDAPPASAHSGHHPAPPSVGRRAGDGLPTCALRSARRFHDDPAMRRMLALTALLVATIAVVPAEAGFKRPKSCRSGETIFNDGRVRLFTVEGTIDGTQAWRYFVCSRRIREPRRYNETSPGLDETHGGFRHTGRYVAYIATYIGGESFDQGFGRLDIRTGRASGAAPRRSDELALLGIAVDEKGGVAYLQETEGVPQTVGYARPRPGGRLGRAKPRTVVAAGDVRPGTLAVRHGVITWKTKAGTAGSVPTG